MCHLKDIEVIKYLIKAREALSENGVIIIRETINEESLLYVNTFKIRSLKVFLFFCKIAGISVVYKHKAKNYPHSFYPLYAIVGKNKINKT